MGVLSVDLVDSTTLVIMFGVNVVYVRNWLVCFKCSWFLVVVRWKDFSKGIPHFQLAIECSCECISETWLQTSVNLGVAGCWGKTVVVAVIRKVSWSAILPVSGLG